MPEPLTPDAVTTALYGLDGWSGDTEALTRTVELADFPTAIRVVDQVAEAAEVMNHHPDIDIRWRTVTFRCSTHSAGGVTASDVSLAQRIDAIVRAQR